MRRTYNLEFISVEQVAQFSEIYLIPRIQKPQTLNKYRKSHPEVGAILQQPSRNSRYAVLEFVTRQCVTDVLKMITPFRAKINNSIHDLKGQEALKSSSTNKNINLKADLMSLNVLHSTNAQAASLLSNDRLMVSHKNDTLYIEKVPTDEGVIKKRKVEISSLASLMTKARDSKLSEISNMRVPDRQSNAYTTNLNFMRQPVQPGQTQNQPQSHVPTSNSQGHNIPLPAQAAPLFQLSSSLTSDSLDNCPTPSFEGSGTTHASKNETVSETSLKALLALYKQNNAEATKREESLIKKHTDELQEVQKSLMAAQKHIANMEKKMQSIRGEADNAKQVSTHHDFIGRVALVEGQKYTFLIDQLLFKNHVKISSWSLENKVLLLSTLKNIEMYTNDIVLTPLLLQLRGSPFDKIIEKGLDALQYYENISPSTPACLPGDFISLITFLEFRKKQFKSKYPDLKAPPAVIADANIKNNVLENFIYMHNEEANHHIYVSLHLAESITTCLTSINEHILQTETIKGNNALVDTTVKVDGQTKEQTIVHWYLKPVKLVTHWCMLMYSLQEEVVISAAQPVADLTSDRKYVFTYFIVDPIVELYKTLSKDNMDEDVVRRFHQKVDAADGFRNQINQIARNKNCRLVNKKFALQACYLSTDLIYEYDCGYYVINQISNLLEMNAQDWYKMFKQDSMEANNTVISDYFKTIISLEYLFLRNTNHKIRDESGL
jgi:hypothetical protein